MDVCFWFRRMGMRELIYPGDMLWETEDIYFGERICFRKTGKKNGIAFPLTDWKCNAVLLRIVAYLREKLYFKTVFLN